MPNPIVYLSAMTYRKYDAKVRSDWQLHLPSSQRILNTRTHTTLGVSPSMMLYGGIIGGDTVIVIM